AGCAGESFCASGWRSLTEGYRSEFARSCPMQIGWLRILGILFAALALIFSGAHLLELPHKIGLSAADYLTVQQLYRGWQFAGIVVVGAIISIAWLAYSVRQERRVFVPTIIALLC